jgi:O-antigen ligase
MDWWTSAWHLFLQHPFTGLGAYAGGKFGVLAQLHLNNGAIHSDYMEVLVDTGICGLLPLLLALGGTWWFLIRGVRSPSLSSEERQLGLECIGVISLLTVHSIFNTELTWHAPLLFFAVLGYAEMMRRRMKSLQQNVHLPRLSPAARSLQPVPARL